MNKKVIKLSNVVGKGYKEFWRDKTHRYIVCKGGRASKKSKTAALWIIYHMMKYPLANTLVVRKNFNTLKDSCWTDLKWAANRLNVYSLWTFSKSPLQATYKPTGQVILFRGLDDPMSITSITVEKGYLCWAWFEESYQIGSEDDFNKIDMSIRGKLPPEYFKRIILTFNPWSEHHWLKKRFFDDPDENTLAMTTNYLCNEWLGEDDIKQFEIMKVKYPRRYQVEGLGNWGILEGLIFDNWESKDFDISKIIGTTVHGMDFGFNDPTTIISSIVDEKNKNIYIFNEIYRTLMTPDDIEKTIKENNLERCEITADNARPEIISQLNKKGCKVRSCKKGKDSIITGIQKLQEYHIYIRPDCEHTIIEFSNYCWDKDKKTGELLDKPVDDFNHCIDSLRYSIEKIVRKKGKARATAVSW